MKIMKAGKVIASEALNAEMILNEQIRNTGENTRVANEVIRQNQEVARENVISGVAAATTDANTAADRANTAAQNAEDIVAGTGLVLSSEKGAANGVATLDATGKVPSAQLPLISTNSVDITYDGTISGLVATDVKTAIDELDANVATAETNAKNYTDTQITLVTSTGIPKLNVYEYKFANQPIGTTTVQIPLETFNKVTDTVKLFINAIPRDSDFFTVGDAGLITLTSALTSESKITVEIWKNIPVGDVGSVSGSVLAINTVPQDRVIGLGDLSTDITDLKENGINSQITLHQDYKSIFNTGIGNDDSETTQDFNTIANGQSNIKIEGLTENNLISNGGFTNSTTGFTGSGSTLLVANNILSITGNGSSATPYAEQQAKFGNNTNKFYIATSAKVTNSYALNLKLRYFGTSGIDAQIITSPISNNWYKLSGIITNNEVSDGNVGVVLLHTYVDSTTANGKIMEVKYVLVINLTSLGLDSLTKEQCDFMFDHYIFGGLQGVNNHKIVSIGKNLFDKTKITPLSDLDTSIGTIIAHSSRSVSDYIRVDNIQNIVLNKAVRMCCYDINKKFIGMGTYIGPYFVTLNCTYYIRVAVIDNVDIQVEIGTIATNYKLYQISELIVTLPQQLHRLPNNIVDIIEEINGTRQLIRQTQEYILLPTDITALITTGTNIDYVMISKKSDGINYNSISATKTFMASFATTSDIFLDDNISSIGKISEINSTIDYIYIFAKGTYATLTEAQTALTGAKIIYQLAQPITYKNGENGFSVTGNIESYPNGMIYVEHTDSKQSSNPKTYITYNLSDKAILMSNSNNITTINNRISNWKMINPWITPTLLNGWINYDTSTYANVAYFKDEFDIVHINGVVKSGTVNTAIFTLPIGYRPSKTTFISIVYFNGSIYGTGRLSISPSGSVVSADASNNLLSLGSITFKAEV